MRQFADIMFEVTDHETKSEIIKRRRALRLPHTAGSILSVGLSTLSSHLGSRSWSLPPTKLSDEISHYYSRHKALGLNGPRPKLKGSIDPSSSEEMALKIDSGLIFVELARSADLLVKPILLYYACVQLCGVYTRAFFNWEKDSRDHGIKCAHDSRDVTKTRVSVSDSGQFPRLATTCFILTGWPSCFSSLVTYSVSPTAHTNPGEVLESLGKVEEGHPVKHLTLDELVTLDYGKCLKSLRNRHGFHKFKGLSTTAFLNDVLALFVASSLARYDVIGWRNILEGKSNDYRIHFEEVFDRFQNFTVDLLLLMLENPLLDFDTRTIPSLPSPYSHDDHFRFKTDPNCAK